MQKDTQKRGGTKKGLIGAEKDAHVETMGGRVSERGEKGAFEKKGKETFRRMQRQTKNTQEKNRGYS